VAYHKVYRQTQLLFSEISDQAEWGNWYWATKNVAGLTHQSGPDRSVRDVFKDTGKLQNTKDTNYRPIRDNWPVFGFSVDLGSVTGPINTLFSLGLAQELAIQFLGKDGLAPVPSLWKTYFSKDTDAVGTEVYCCYAKNTADRFSSPSFTMTTATQQVPR